MSNTPETIDLVLRDADDPRTAYYTQAYMALRLLQQ